jgi:hypothetical protein
LLKDPNDMHCAGYDLREWITGVLTNVTQPIADTASDNLLVCSDCKRKDTNPDETFIYDDDGVLFCPQCWDRRELPAVTFTPDPEDERRWSPDEFNGKGAWVVSEYVLDTLVKYFPSIPAWLAKTSQPTTPAQAPVPANIEDCPF